jgi:hypothetical protein
MKSAIFWADSSLLAIESSQGLQYARMHSDDQPGACPRSGGSLPDCPRVSPSLSIHSLRHEDSPNSGSFSLHRPRLEPVMTNPPDTASVCAEQTRCCQKE